MAEDKIVEKMGDFEKALKNVNNQLVISKEILGLSSHNNFELNLLNDTNAFVVSFKEPPPFRNLQPGTIPSDSPQSDENI